MSPQALSKVKYGSFLKGNLLKGRVDQYELSLVLVELSTLMASGLSLINALRLIKDQTSNRAIKDGLDKVMQEIEKGRSLYRAFSEAGIFPEFFIEMLRTAESGENLKQVLKIAGQYLQKTVEARAKFFTAIAYPIFVIFASLLAVLVVVKVVVPKIAGVLESLGKELPLITKALVLFSVFLSYFVYLIPILAVLYVFRHRFIKKEFWDRYMLGVPILGRLSLYYNLSRFASSLYMSLSSNIPITRAIALSLGSISNVYLRASLIGVEQEVAKGKSLSLALRERRVLPETFLNLLAMGERSGELEKSLMMISELYERQAERVISFWLRFAEPLAMLVVGALVAVVVLSVVLPLSEISAGVRR